MSRLVSCLLAAVLALGMTGVAMAQDPAQVTEQQRLHGELERVNAEIDALKRPGRGVRDDYRLRQRMADAEALARRLTEIEAQLGPRRPAAATAAPAPAPAAAPGDGPAELEAKADVLTDQARRLAAQAEALEARSAQLQARQELRRRSSEMDRDPLSPFDGSKRRTVSGIAPTATTSATPPPKSTDSGYAAAGPPPVGPTAGGRPVDAPSPATVLSTSFSVQFRDYLDPGAVAEIRKLESTHAPGWETQAMRRAAGGLRARATELDRQAQALRKQAGK